MEGVNGKYLISVGTDYLHNYTIESNGAVGKQASEINTQNYGGSECGNTTGVGAILDHTGKYFYVQLFGAGLQEGNTICAAWRSNKIASNGELTFLGDTEYESWTNGSAGASTVPTISSNDMFAYGLFYWYDGFSYNTFSTFSRSEAGFLEVNQNYTEIDPAANPNSPGGGPWFFISIAAAADPASHLAVLMSPFWVNSETNQVYGPNQLANYTIDDATGGIASTNTWKDMPATQITTGNGLSMSPSGKLLAVFGQGLQLFHFNGANPITAYSDVLLPNVPIGYIAWDDNDHLYALSYSPDNSPVQLYVYTVTPTSIGKVAGSPITVSSPYGSLGMTVVPK
jgi:hypothetical protein